MMARPAGAKIRIDDGFVGSCTFDVASEVGDFPIARRAGAAALRPPWPSPMDLARFERASAYEGATIG